MACNCGITVIVDPPAPSCANCLKLYGLRVPCDTGPAPCGGVDGTVVIDLADYNDITACSECEGTYSIYAFDTVGITSATTTDEGVVTIVTNSTFVDRDEYEIVYKFECPCQKLAGYGSIFVCKQNLCFGVTCGEGETCNPCTGVCE